MRKELRPDAETVPCRVKLLGRTENGDRALHPETPAIPEGGHAGRAAAEGAPGMRCSRDETGADTRQRGGGDAEKNVLARKGRWTRAHRGLLAGPPDGAASVEPVAPSRGDQQFAVAGGRSSAHGGTSYRV